MTFLRGSAQLVQEQQNRFENVAEASQRISRNNFACFKTSQTVLSWQVMLIIWTSGNRWAKSTWRSSRDSQSPRLDERLAGSAAIDSTATWDKSIQVFFSSFFLSSLSRRESQRWVQRRLRQTLLVLIDSPASSRRATLKDLHNAVRVCSHFSGLQETPWSGKHPAVCFEPVASRSAVTNRLSVWPKLLMKPLLMSHWIHARHNEGALRFGLNF